MRQILIALALIWTGAGPALARDAQSEMAAGAEWSQSFTEVQSLQVGLFGYADMFANVFDAWDSGTISEEDARMQTSVLRAALDRDRARVRAATEALPPPPRFRSLSALGPAYRTMYDSLTESNQMIDELVASVANQYEQLSSGESYDKTPLMEITMMSARQFVIQQQAMLRTLANQMPGSHPRMHDLFASVSSYDGLLAAMDINRSILIDGGWGDEDNEIQALRRSAQAVRTDVSAGLESLRTTRDTLRMSLGAGGQVGAMARDGLDIYSDYERTFDNHTEIASLLDGLADALAVILDAGPGEQEDLDAVLIAVETTLVRFEALELANGQLSQRRLDRLVGD